MSLTLYVISVIMAWISIVVLERLDPSSKIHNGCKYNIIEFAVGLTLMLVPYANFALIGTMLVFLVPYTFSKISLKKIIPNISVDKPVRWILLDFKPKKGTK